MNVSSFFQGSVLKFSVTGEGVTIDPETGELSIAAEALASGLTVTVLAQDASGAAESIKFTIAAAPSSGAPTLLTPPVLTGSGRIGEALSVTPGEWGGEPAPKLAQQWLCNGTVLTGETGEAYVPQAGDDGRAIACRVTASNAAGSLSAESAPVLVTRESPVAIGLLADVTAVQGDAAVSVAAAAVFAGEGLRFSVAGAGAQVDPATGVLSLPTDAVLAGETVTVTATNSGGSVEASFLVTVTEREPVPVAPAVVTNPALAGPALVGRELVVQAGLWSGLPVPVLALQWLRDGAEIAGATAAAYVPGPEDDRCALSCRVTGQNTAGSATFETATLSVTYVAPTLSGELFDEIFDQGAGPETVSTAQVFTGENLSFAVSGAGAVIDPATGVVTLSTDAALSGAAVTVTATNSGGSAAASFLVTVEAPVLAFPLMLADSAWSASEVRAAAPAGRRQVTIAAGVVPAGYELCLYSGVADGRDNTSWRKVMQAGATYTTNSSMAVGSTCLNLLFWRRVADGAWAVASNEIVFPIAGLEVPPQLPPAAPGFPAASQTLASATQASLIAALNARISSGSTADWVISLPAGDYGSINLDDFRLPGKTTLRSANFPATGAKFRSIRAQRAKNIYFEFAYLDRTGQGYIDRAVDFSGSSYCGISYSDLYFGPTVRNNLAQGWAQQTGTGIWLYKDSVNQVLADHITVHMNYLHGAADTGIYTGNCTYLTISENVFADTGGDDMQLGCTRWSDFINNWGSREKYPSWSAADGWKHTDFIQTVSKTVETPGNRYIGNVAMKGLWTSYQGQMLFGNGSILTEHLFENNILLTNSVSGIMYAGSDACHDNVGRNNTCLRLVDDFYFSNLHFTQFRLPGATVISANVQCSNSGDPSAGADGLNIVMKAGDYSASLAYYTNPSKTASFYDLRPVSGKPTHWAYSGAKVGAYQRFDDVINKGKYPKIGPAAAAWKAQYDPKNQITS